MNEPNPYQEFGDSRSPLGVFRCGQEVMYRGEKRAIYDVDEGYGILALDGDKYIAPNHACNRCIEARMDECEIILPNK